MIYKYKNDPIVISYLKNIKKCREEIIHFRYPTLIQKHFENKDFQRIYPLCIFSRYQYICKKMESITETVFKGDIDIQKKFVKLLNNLYKENTGLRVCKELNIQINESGYDIVSQKISATLYYFIFCEQKYSSKYWLNLESEQETYTSFLKNKSFPEFDVDTKCMSTQNKLDVFKSITKREDKILTKVLLNSGGNEVNVDLPKELSLEEFIKLLIQIKCQLLKMFYSLIGYGSNLIELIESVSDDITAVYACKFNQILTVLNISPKSFHLCSELYKDNNDVKTFIQQFQIYKCELVNAKPISIFHQYIDTDTYLKYKQIQDLLLLHSLNNYMQTNKITFITEEMLTTKYSDFEKKTSVDAFQYLDIKLPETIHCGEEFMLLSSYFSLALAKTYLPHLNLMIKIKEFLASHICTGTHIAILDNNPLKNSISVNNQVYMKLASNSFIGMLERCLVKKEETNNMMPPGVL